MNYLTLAFPIALSALLLAFFCYYWRVMTAGDIGSYAWIKQYGKRGLVFRCHPFTRKDILPLVLILLAYGVVAFWNLGENTAPQSRHTFEKDAPSAILKLEGETDVSQVLYFSGLYTGNYKLEFSADGKTWFEAPKGEEDEAVMPQTYSDLFKWLYAATGEINGVTELRVTAMSFPLELSEVALLDADGNLILYTCAEAPELLDEQDTVPEYPFWTNSTYFDEIYHARTALENIRNIYPYELSHPPLGKLIIAVGIQIFGMTPFGWRFMGTLFGILMLIPFYILLKNMFGKTPVAVCGTLLFAFDFMHFVQTRIATIDTYGVIFILLSYLFMWRYVCRINESGPEDEVPAPCESGLSDTPGDFAVITSEDEETAVRVEKPANEAAFDRAETGGAGEMAESRKGLPGLSQLLLSGLFFGIGCASKWIVVYAGAGLALIYAIGLISRGLRAYRGYDMRDYAFFLVKTLLWSVLGFVTVPVVIYCLSYIPYGLARGMTFPEMLKSPDYYKLVWDNQVFMLNYHEGVHQEHPYSSRWWQWISDIRPILYYLKYEGDVKSAFGCFNNPVTTWAGLLALGSLPLGLMRRKNAAALFIFIGYFSQLLPWIIITRTTFAYHYFPSSVFLLLAICYVLNGLYDKGKRKLVYVFTGGTLALFPVFYPVLTGVWANKQQCIDFLKWLPSWPFG